MVKESVVEGSIINLLKNIGYEFIEKMIFGLKIVSWMNS